MEKENQKRLFQKHTKTSSPEKWKAQKCGNPLLAHLTLSAQRDLEGLQTKTNGFERIFKKEIEKRKALKSTTKEDGM